jgi:CRISPR-associated protein Cmr3
MFQWLIKVKPLGFLYGSAGAFLSAENLVGKSGAKFPPDASVMSGLILRNYQERTDVSSKDIKKFRLELTVAGAFWAKDEDVENGYQDFYVPIPRSRTIGDNESAEWEIQNHAWHREQEGLQAEFSWQKISYWDDSVDLIQRDGVAKTPWKFNPFLHPQLQQDQRHVLEQDGLFLENAVQMSEDTCLVYLSTYEIPDGWYRFGGESHIVEISSQALKSDLTDLLNKPIKKSFALICPAVWGTNNLSERYPSAFKASHKPPQMLTDRPVPFRYRLGKGDHKNSSILGVGRYAVPAGTVYVLKHDLNKTWWEFPNEWFPQSKGQVASSQNTLLKQLGCGLCLPITINGVD